MIQSKTSLRFALHATQSCIGEPIEDCFLTGPGDHSFIQPHSLCRLKLRPIHKLWKPRFA